MFGLKLGLGLNGASGASGGGGGGDSDLLADLTTAAGTAPTALWIPGVETFSDDQGTPAGDGDRVYQINDQTGNGAHLRQGGTDKGPILRSSGSNGIGNKPAFQFASSNAEFLVSLVTMANMDTPLFNANLAGSAAALATYTSLTARHTLIGAGGANGVPLGLMTQGSGAEIHWCLVGLAFPNRPHTVDVARVYNGRRVATNGKGIAGVDKDYSDPGNDSTTPELAQTFRWGHHARSGYSHMQGFSGPLATWAVTLSDAQMNAVVDVLRAYAGLDPIADPE